MIGLVAFAAIGIWMIYCRLDELIDILKEKNKTP